MNRTHRICNSNRSCSETVPFPRTQREKKKLEKMLESTERECGGANEGATSRLALQKRLEEALEALRTHDANKQNVSTNFQSAKRALKERYHFWRTSIRLKSQEADMAFNTLLQNNGMAGKLDFDHERDLLDASVQVHQTDAHARSCSSMKSLSGGEQSYCAFVLALSMWKFNDSPVRARNSYL